MAKTEVLLTSPIVGLGQEGEKVMVAAGYARNFLIPKEKAVSITHANEKRVNALIKAREARLAKELEDAKQLAEKVRELKIVFAVKTGDSGKMFGAVTVNNLLEKIEENGLELEKKMLSLPKVVKTLGQHTVRVKLHSKVAVELNFEVVSENPIEAEAESK